MPTASPHPPVESTSVVLLLHTFSDGSTHYDWLIEIPHQTDEYRLLSFRTQNRPDRLENAEMFHVEQFPNHRAHYLTYEGPLDPGDAERERGWVERVASGRCVGFGWIEEPGSADLVIEWDEAGVGRYIGSRVGEGRWVFRRVEIALANG